MPFRDRHSGGAPPRPGKREGRLRPLDGGGRLLELAGAGVTDAADDLVVRMVPPASEPRCVHHTSASHTGTTHRHHACIIHAWYVHTCSMHMHMQHAHATCSMHMQHMPMHRSVVRKVTCSRSRRTARRSTQGHRRRRRRARPPDRAPAWGPRAAASPSLRGGTRPPRAPTRQKAAVCSGLRYPRPAPPPSLPREQRCRTECPPRAPRRRPPGAAPTRADAAAAAARR